MSEEPIPATSRGLYTQVLISSFFSLMQVNGHPMGQGLGFGEVAPAHPSKMYTSSLAMAG